MSYRDTRVHTPSNVSTPPAHAVVLGSSNLSPCFKMSGTINLPNSHSSPPEEESQQLTEEFHSRSLAYDSYSSPQESIEYARVRSLSFKRSVSYGGGIKEEKTSQEANASDLVDTSQETDESKEDGASGEVKNEVSISETCPQSFGSTPSSVLSSLSSFRHSRPYAEVAYSPTPDVNEVYPGLYVGDAVAAKDKAFLRRMGINYVLNTAEGPRFTQVDTNHLYYRDCPGLRYKGFQLMDLPTTDISKYFHIAANFIDEGISRGRVLVHCLMGVSRSATCALAFLMIKRGMSLTEALATVRARRDIHPNEGFLRQLQQLDRELRGSRLR